jgi:single-stranded DNA-binding protein
MATTKARFDITGRIGKITPTGNAVKGSLGADAFWRSANGENTKITLWRTLTVFGKTAENVSAHRKVGDLVGARDELEGTSYKNDEGCTVHKTDRNVDRFDVLRAAKDEPQEPAPSQDDMSEMS